MSEDKSLTVATSNDQVLFQPIGFQSTDGFGDSALENISPTIKVGSSKDIVSPPAIVFSHTQGLDAQPSEVASPTLRMNGSGHAAAYDEYNDSIADTHHTLRAGTKQSTGVLTTTIVRRLTPTECERLQGFEDGWTAERVNLKTGQVVPQADSARYKQMGNAVAVPCVEWIINRLTSQQQEPCPQPHT